MFKLASFSSKGHSSAEKFLFKQCLMKEIQCLDEGFAISINGQSYLIQCRLIQFVLDTKEVEHQVNVQCINAYSGCPYCFGTFGTTFDDIKNKMAISDERWRLPLFHATRHHGQTANCCPRHKSSEPFFYTNRFEYQEGKQDYNQGDCEKDDNLPQKKKEKLKQKIIPAAATELELTKPRVAQDMALQLVPYWFDVCDEANAKIIKRYLFYGNQEASLWFHDQNHYPMEMITTSEFFYYPTCNFQAFQQFRRKDRRFHQTRAASIINKRLSGYVRNKKDTVHEEGVKDHFYGFDSKYVSFEKHLNFDPAHAFTNCFDYLKDFWTGVCPEINADLFAHCSTTKCWSFIEEIAKQNTTEDNNNKRDNNNINKKKDKDKNNLGFPWNISNQNQTKIDSWIISLIIPVGFKDTFEVKSLFVYTKTQKFNIKMNIIKSIIPLVMFLLDREMPTEYKALFMMFSELVVDLMSPVIDSSDIASDLLHYRVIEFLVLFQGFFPPTEHHMVFHFLIHFAKHIKVAGIIKNWSSYAGERGNSFVKSFIKRGGANFEKTSSRKYYNHESSIIDSIEESAFKVNSNGKFNRKSIIGRELLDSKVFFLDVNQSFQYNPFRMLVYDEQLQCIDVAMNHFEATNFLNCLIKEIMKQCKNKEEAYERSEFFKLYCKHVDLSNNFSKTWYKRKNLDNSTIKRNETAEIMFFDFLVILYTIKTNEEAMEDDQLENARIKLFEIMNTEKESNNSSILNCNNLLLLLKKLFKHMRYNQASSLKAMVYGLRCKGRGYEKRRFGSTGESSDYRLNMQQSWNTNKLEYSSWCKFRFNRFSILSTNDLNNQNDYYIGNPHRTYYGQTNFFIKLNIPSEKLLNGVKIASMTAVSNHSPCPLWNYKSKNTNDHYKSKTVIDCIDVNKIALLNNSLFIPLTDILATKYGMIGVDDNDKPFFNKRNLSYINHTNEKKFKNCFSDESSDKIYKLYFIPLHPERINICYSIHNSEMYNS